jgi:hypothetical protein
VPVGLQRREQQVEEERVLAAEQDGILFDGDLATIYHMPQRPRSRHRRVGILQL